MSVRIADDGELEVKGPNIFKGYWRNAEETREAFTPDGFFRTGDIGRIDEEGWIYITDRKKQLIITSAGKNIAPAAVERELLLCPHIEMAYVHGDRRNYLTALIVLNEIGDEADRALLRDGGHALAGACQGPAAALPGAGGNGPGQRETAPVHAGQVFPGSPAVLGGIGGT